jgi:hypothetical protein
VRYIDAGYIIALISLALYAVWLVYRRRRLEAAVARRGPGPGVPLSAIEREGAGPPAAEPGSRPVNGRAGP